MPASRIAGPICALSQRSRSLSGAADALGAGGEIAAVVLRGRDARQRVGERFTIDEQHARVAADRDFRQVFLDDGKALAVVGERLEHDARILVARRHHENRASAHAVQRLADDGAVRGGELRHLVHVARHQGGRAALGKPGGVDLFVHVAQALGPVHDQSAGPLRALENVRRIDVFRVKGRVLAHQHHVEFAHAAGFGGAQREPILRIGAHRKRAGACPGLHRPQGSGRPSQRSAGRSRAAVPRAATPESCPSDT